MKTTEQKILGVFRELFDPVFSELGFVQRADTKFCREHQGVEHIVGFTLHRDREGVFRLTGGVGVRVAAIEAIIRPDSELGHIPTVGKPFHLLRPDQELRPWVFVQQHELAALRPSIMDEVQRYALPFFERYGDYASVFGALKSDNPQDWFMATNDMRDALLVADALLNQGQEAAVKLGAELLKKYGDRMSKYSLNLRAVFERARGKGPTSQT